MEWYWPFLAVQTLLLCLLLFYFYLDDKFTYWSRRGVPGPTPSLLTLGTIYDRIRYSPSEYEQTYLAQYGTVYGLYRLFHPTLTIADVTILKRILIQDFHLFANRAHLNTYDELWNENIFHAHASAWKRIRTIASPTFTSGKLKRMQPLMASCVAKLCDFFETTSGKGGVFSAKEVACGFTQDVIASSSFALETNANAEQGASPFVANGLALFRMSPLRILAFLLLPRRVNSWLGIRNQFPPKPFSFFAQLAREVLKKRRQGGLKRSDFLQSLIDAYALESELKEGKDDYGKLTADLEKDETQIKAENISSSSTLNRQSLTDTEVIAQSIFFFIAGFETTASTLTHLLFELVQNPDIQERLHETLASTLSELDVTSEVYYETVMNQIPYLDAVIKEGLRKYPPLTRVERRCAVDGYRLGHLTLRKGEHIEVSLYAVHHNPDYYPEPERFNPERFMPENKAHLVPYTYMPFGTGPRNCLGLRFAYQELKMVLAGVLLRFRFSATVETPTSLGYNRATLLLNTLPFKLAVSKRG